MGLKRALKELQGVKKFYKGLQRFTGAYNETTAVTGS